MDGPETGDTTRQLTYDDSDEVWRDVVALQMIAEDVAAFANYGRADLIHVCNIAEPHGTRTTGSSRSCTSSPGRSLTSTAGWTGPASHGRSWQPGSWMRYRADVDPNFPSSIT
jgi:hypothetical protein